MRPSEPLSQLDFLLVFDAVLRCGSITKAADELGISQSALCHALVRLRARFGDPLFVRSGATMQPSPLVVSMLDPLRRAMSIIRDDILVPAHFDPETTDRVFRLCVNEVGALLLVPRILRLLHKRAPHASLAPLDVPREEIFGRLEAGAIDLAVGHYPELKASVYQQSLFRRKYVAIVRRRHPVIGARATMAQLLQTPMVRCSAIVSMNRWIEGVFAKAGRSPVVALETPYVMAMATVVAATDWMAYVPEELLPLLRGAAQIQAVETPMGLPTVDVRQHWHRRYKDDPANRFIRQLVYEALHE